MILVQAFVTLAMNFKWKRLVSEKTACVKAKNQAGNI